MASHGGGGGIDGETVLCAAGIASVSLPTPILAFLKTFLLERERKSQRAVL